MSRTAQQNAAEFGRLTKQGKDVRLALLVACSVVKRSRGRHSNVSIETLKMNASDFATAAGTGNDRILRHLAAWEKLADAGLVPHSADLSPKDALDLDVSDAAIAAFDANGLNSKNGGITVGAQKTADIIANKQAVVRAIKSNPEFAKAAAEASVEATINLIRDDEATADKFAKSTRVRDALIKSELRAPEPQRQKRDNERWVKERDAHFSDAKFEMRASNWTVLMLEIESAVEWVEKRCIESEESKAHALDLAEMLREWANRMEAWGTGLTDPLSEEDFAAGIEDILGTQS